MRPWKSKKKVCIATLMYTFNVKETLMFSGWRQICYDHRGTGIDNLLGWGCFSKCYVTNLPWQDLSSIRALKQKKRLLLLCPPIIWKISLMWGCVVDGIWVFPFAWVISFLKSAPCYRTVMPYVFCQLIYVDLLVIWLHRKKRRDYLLIPRIPLTVDIGLYASISGFSGAVFYWGFRVQICIESYIAVIRSWYPPIVHAFIDIIEGQS